MIARYRATARNMKTNAVKTIDVEVKLSDAHAALMQVATVIGDALHDFHAGDWCVTNVTSDIQAPPGFFGKPLSQPPAQEGDDEHDAHL